MIIFTHILSSGCLFSGPIEEHKEYNRSPEIDYSKIAPVPFSHIKFDNSNFIDFKKISPDAIVDPDADEICYLWIWDYDANDPSDFSKVGKYPGCGELFSEYTVYPCKVLKNLQSTEKYHLLELVYADTYITEERKVEKDGFIHSIYWWVEFKPGICEEL